MRGQMSSLPSATKGHINHSAALAFKGKIAHNRNRYAHSAGSFPTSTGEVDAFVSEVHACLSMIV